MGIVMIAALAACGPREPACPEPADGKRFLSDEESPRALEAAPAPFTSPVEVEWEEGRLSLIRW